MMNKRMKRRILTILLFVLICNERDVYAFVSSPSRQILNRSSLTTGSSLQQIPKFPLSHLEDYISKRELRYQNVLKSSSSSLSESSESKNDSIVLASIAVGAVTATIGYLYSIVLGISTKTIWERIPSFLVNQFGGLNPAYFIIGTLTTGGILMGLLSYKLHSTFAVSDFVSAFSSAPAGILPPSRNNLLQVLILSCITSSFGFSLGPEAPMVCAGGLTGASIARLWFGREKNKSDETMKKKQETLAYAGAAGALTASMGIPIAGSIFALEMTRSNAGLSRAGESALSPAVIASVAALVIIRAVLMPSTIVGGHFTYGTVGALSGRSMIATAVACSFGGALLGTFFHKFVHLLKAVAWPTSKAKKAGDSESNKNPWKRHLVVKSVIGFLVGIISLKYPQTMFWGEGSLQSVIDGQNTPFAATKHGLSNLLTSGARVNPNLPFTGAAAATEVGIAKILAICLACTGKFPGGIIFPLFFAAAPFAHAACSLLGATGSSIVPVAVMCLMSATQASATRTPLASTLILSLTASATSELSTMLPACLLSSYLSIYLSQRISRNSYFQYNE